MTEQLREKIAKEIGEWRWKDSFYGEYVTENDRNSCRIEAGLVLDLIKEVGYVSPEEMAEKDRKYLESEKMLLREDAFEEQRLRDEVKYWKNKDYRLG